MRILVVEDEPHLNDVIVKRLVREHYSVDSCTDGNDALDHIRCAEYDAIVLDIMLPGRSGMEVLREMRSSRNRTPVLLLTAKDAIGDRVKGFDAGADDYLVKPFAFEELLARIRVIIRRNENLISSCIEIDDLTVDCDKRTVARGGVAVELTSREFDVLEYLARNAGIVLSRDKISQHLWNYEYEGGSNVIDVYIRYLRRKIDDGHNRKLIHTIRGAGYVIREES